MSLTTRPASTRDDIEWVMGPTGPFLQYKPEWSKRHAAQIERDREDERRRWIHRHNQANRDD